MEFKFLIFLVVWLVGEISCDVKYTFPEVNYCSHLSRCEPDKCCKRYGGHLFGGIGKCEPLRLEGQACDLGCPCAPGSKCAVNPLCPTCRTICIRDEVITSLNGYLNKACFTNCKDDRLNHLFKPKTCLLKLYRNEGESCNEWCKCAPGTYCAPNILCPYCDNICMNMSTVNSLVHYFNVGCLNCNEDISPVLFTRANMRFNRLNFDANNCIVFPTLF